MAKEGKFFEVSGQDIDKTIHFHQAWGWEFVSVNDTGVLCNRDTSSPKYKKLVANETKYYELLEEYGKPNKVIEKPKMSVLVFILLLLVVLLPGILYLAQYIAKYNQYKEDVSLSERRYNENKESLFNEMTQLELESRNYFLFG